MLICLLCLLFSLVPAMSADEVHRLLRVPKVIKFYDVPAGTRALVENGSFVARQTDGQYSKDELPESLKGVPPSPDNCIILGAPATVTKYLDVDASQVDHGGSTPTVGVLVKSHVILVTERRVKTGDAVETHFLVYSFEGGLKQIAEFKLKDNVYNVRLDEAYAFSPAGIGIVLRSSRHPYMNALIVFDIDKARVAGYTEFSLLQYMAKENGLWCVDSVANTVEREQEVDELSRKTKVLPIYKNGALNKDIFEAESLLNVEVIDISSAIPKGADAK